MQNDGVLAAEIAGEETAAAQAPSAAVEEEKPYQLTIKRGFLAVLILLGAQFFIALPMGIVVGVMEATNDDSVGTEAAMPLIIAVALILGAVALFFWVRRDLRKFGPTFGPQIGLNPSKLDFKQAALLIAAVFILVRVFAYLYGLAFLPAEGEGSVRGEAEQIFDQARAAGSFLGMGLMLLATIIFAPIVEEIAFRGYLQSALKRRMPTWVALVIASAVFASIHGSLLLWPIYFMIGAGLGYVFERTGSLKTAIAFHVVNNVIFGVAAVLGLV